MKQQLGTFNLSELDDKSIDNFSEGIVKVIQKQTGEETQGEQETEND